ncbi:MAG: DUF4199 family protein [Bacteroidales bacterium]|nr:DUF4199 family protein [Bacteroidales bacterium]
MKGKLDNTLLWNEAAKAGLLLGLVSVSCLLLKELAGQSGSDFLTQAAVIILWTVEFFGCILLMKKVQLDLRDKYEDIKMADTFRLGRRAALLSGLVLASAQALVIMYMPQETMEELVSAVSESMNMTAAQQEEVNGMMDKLPVLTFLFQWLYCFLYGTVLSSIMSRYIFFQKLFGGPFDGPEDKQNTPDEQ